MGRLIRSEKSLFMRSEKIQHLVVSFESYESSDLLGSFYIDSLIEKAFQ